MSVDETITFSLAVKNTGNREGQEIVQLYIRDIKSSLPRSVKELKRFKKVNLMPGEEFSRLIENCGYHASVEVKAVRRKEADLETGKLLGLEPGEEIYEVEKVYFADGHPAIISVDCFACDLIGIDLTCEFMAGRSIFEVLHQYGGCFIARDKISMETMNREEMEKSVVSGKEMECDSVLVFRGKNYNQENKLVMLDREFYDTRYIQFSLLRVKNV